MASYSVGYREREDSGTNKELKFDTVEAAAKAFIDTPARLYPHVFSIEKSRLIGRDTVKTLATTEYIGKHEHYMPQKRAIGTEAGDAFSSAYWQLLGERMRKDGAFSKEEISFITNNPLKQGVGAFIEQKAMEVGRADKAMGNSFHDQAVKEIVEAVGSKGAFAESFSKRYGHEVNGTGLVYTSGLAQEMLGNPLYGVELKSASIHERIDELKQMGMSTLQTLSHVSDFIATSHYAGVALDGAGGGRLITQVSAMSGLASGIEGVAVATDGGIDKHTLQRDLKAIQELIKEPISFTEFSQGNAHSMSVKGVLQKAGDEWSFSPSEGIRIGKDTLQAQFNDFGRAGELFDILLDGARNKAGLMDLTSNPMFYADGAKNNDGKSLGIEKEGNV